ncbi:glutathione S-transferase family protein [Solimonas sp. K1W22B-7]|uniref:glutathione S-transferase family protein n=1 Tax=Solimonas sp. K1W22B-7 TaxID=2303331 RepID=UPI000E336FBD|nr:glutathione S-transferase family protein [Solimonas sp. K1W22B-7]AXQ30589.1 glutathione S-transferase family protein [Solimonas sp. K1W22B-7]
MKLWHCKDSRSLRPLWTLEELGMPYDLEVMPFPPRYLHKGYLGVNVLGTVPYFADGDARMTESSGICLYLIDKYRRYDLGLEPGHPEFGNYLNWLFHSDATLTFPQTIYLRYTLLEPEERRLPQAAADYRKWYLARLRLLDSQLESRDFLCDNRFTIADIAIGFALYLGEILRISDDYSPQVKAYLARLKARPAFQRSVALE